MSAIDLSNLTSEISATLALYSNNVNDEMLKWMEKTAKETAKDCKKLSPRRSGKYASGWTAKKYGSGWKIYNKKRPGLAHLTEHGHPIIRNGRVVGKAKAQTHIKTAENNAIEKVADLEKKIAGGL